MGEVLPSTFVYLGQQEKPSRTNDSSIIQRTLAHLSQDLEPKSLLLEVELLLLALAIGIQDAISFPDFHCFASNQTGNTVLFAVGLLLNSQSSDDRSTNMGNTEASLFAISTIAVSLCFFILGVFLTGQTANYLHITHSTRGWLVLTNALQTILVFIAAGLQMRYSGIVGPDTTLGRLIVGLLAFSSGSQVAVVRSLKITDITTAMATAAYIDIFIDPKLFAKLCENRARNRRILFLVMLVLGSFAGAGVGRKAGLGVAVAVSGGLKMVVTGMFLVNRERDERCGDCIE